MVRKTISDAVVAAAGTVASMAAGLAVMPHLIAVMGNATYGLWTLIAGVAVYLGIMDFGVTAAVYRLTARARADSQRKSINELLSTCFALLATLGAVLAILTWLAPVPFISLFHVPADRVDDVRLALWVVGGTVALTVPFETFTGLLWAHERFDVLNAVTIGSAVARAAFILTYVGPAYPLIHVALINAVISLTASVIRVWISYRTVPSLSIGLQYVRRARIKELMSFGMWMNMLTITKALLPQIIAALVATLISASALTTFAIGRQLVFYTNDFTNAATQVLAPRAARLNADGDLASQRAMFLEGGRFALALGCFFWGGYFAFGAYFIQVWQHGRQNGAYILLIILMAGEVMPTSQWITYSQIVGALGQRALAYFAIAEVLLSTVACAVVLPRLGLVAGCIAIAAVATLARGVMRCWYGCRLLEVSVAKYLREVFPGILLRSILVILVAALVGQWVRPSNWAAVLGSGAAYTVVFGVAVVVPLLGMPRLRALALSFAHLRR